MTALAALCLASLAITLAAQACAHLVLRRRATRLQGALPPVSILKPLKGVDDGLYANLASFARLDHPDYEVLCGVASADDPAAAVVRRVQRDFPAARVSLYVCREPFGRNPKVATLAALEKRARHEVLLISDSNVRARPAYLRDMLAELERPGVGLVSSVLAGEGEETLGALCENLQLAGFVAAGVCAAQVVAGHACVVGKSMMFRKADLARVGGFRRVRHVLAEDYVLGRRFQKAGYTVALSSHVLGTVNERWELSRFLERHLRWAQMRRRLSPLAYAGEFLLNPVPLLCALLVAGQLWALAGLALKLAADLALLQKLRGARIALKLAPTIVVKDFLVLGVWIVGAFRRTVEWRGNALRLARGSVLLPLRTRTHAAPAALARDAA